MKDLQNQLQTQQTQLQAKAAATSTNLNEVNAKLQKAKEEECVVDATQGRRTRAVIITNAGYIVLSALQPDTLTGRFNEISGNKLSEE